MIHKYDIIILGLGAMGSAALYQLARQSQAVLGIDQFSPPHIYGSTHGDTRITRQAIGEGEQYTPLALRSYELWKEIEDKTRENLLTITGGLIISKHQSDFLVNTMNAAKKYHIHHEVLEASKLRIKFPQFNVQDDDLGFYEFNAGFLRPEKCVTTQLLLAQQYGAHIHQNEIIENFEEINENCIRVKTNQGEYQIKKLIITAGAWLPNILEEIYAKLFTVTRQVLFWFDIQNAFESFSQGHFPVFIYKPNPSTRIGGIYGFPAIDGINGGIKIAQGQYGEVTDVNSVNRQVSAQEINLMYENYIAPYLPKISRQCIKAVTCLYTNTPDENFIIDTHPNHPAVLIVSPCSGHGFKYSAAIGEIVAELIIESTSTLDISGFKLGRLKY
jgi:sarcosine oxidase